MAATGTTLAFRLGDRGLVLEFADGQVDLYRIRAGELEFHTTRWDHCDWSQLTPEDILQHLALQTPVATWLKARIRLVPKEVAA